MRLLQRTLVFAAAVLLVIGGAGLAAGSADSAVMGARAPQTGTSPVSGYYAALIVVDAARYDQFDLAQMPNLGRLAAKGTVFTSAWVGQLPSITETSHATIATGVIPARHGILGDTWRVPGTSQMAPNLLNAQLTRTGYIGKFMQSMHVPSIETILRQRYPNSPSITLSGHKIYAADALGAGTADYVVFGAKDSKGRYVPSAIPGRIPARTVLTNPQLELPEYPRQPGVEDAWTTSVASDLVQTYRPRLLMMNLPEVDIYGHIAGTDASVMQPLVTNVDLQIGRLMAAYQQAGLLSRTYFIVTSDHGMVPAIHTVDSTRIESTIKNAGGTPLYVGHGDYSPIWLKDLASVPRVAEALAGANIPNVAAVYAKTVNGRYVLVSPAQRLADPKVQRAYGEVLQSFDSGESPDIVLIYDENTITMTPSFAKVGRKGDHGGVTWGSQHIPLVISGPGIKKAYRSSYPARLIDIAPTVETLLGARPANQDGVPLANAMTTPPSWAVSLQNLQTARLTEEVQALQHEAQLRPNTR